MKPKKVYRYLNSLSRAEQRTLLSETRSHPRKRFIQSYLQGKHDRWSEDELHEHVFDGGESGTSTLAQIRHRIAQQIEEYLISDELAKDPLLKRSLLSQGLSSRGLSKDRAHLLKEFSKDLYSAPLCENTYRKSYRLQRIRLELSLRRGEKESGEQAMSETLEALEASHSLELMSLFCAGRNLSMVNAASFSEESLLAILQKVNEFEKEKFPLHAIYRGISQFLLDRDDEKSFQEVLVEFKQIYTRMAPQTQRSLFLYLQNHCIHHHNHHGNREKLIQAIELIEWGMQVGIPGLAGPEIPGISLSNLISWYCIAGQPMKAQGVLEKFSGKIVGDGHAHIQAYCRALIEYYNGHLDPAKRILEEILNAGKDRYYHLNSRLLLWRIHLWEENWLLLFELKNTYLRFFSRIKSLPTKRRELFMLFIDLSVKLAEILQAPKGNERTQKLHRLDGRLDQLRHIPLIKDLRAKLRTKLENQLPPPHGGRS